MTGNIRLKFVPQEGKDYTEPQSVVDSEGFTWNFGPNQTRVLPDDANRLTMAANATVKWGQTTQQTTAPEVKADVDDHAGRT